MNGRKVAVCYPGDTATVFMAFVESALNIETPEGCEVRWFRGVGWCQARRRTHAAEQALEWGADLIACLDIDQVYEPDILVRLVRRHDEGCDVIAAMAPMRGYVRSSKMKPFQRLAWKFDDAGEFVPVDPEDGELQECEFPTSAAILFRASDLQRLPQPWYEFKFERKSQRQIYGEDATFAIRMRSLGVKTWVDTTIRVKHAHVFAIDETFPDRFSDWSEDGVGEAAICGYEA